MKNIALIAFVITTLLSCSGNKETQSEVVDFEQIAKFALNQPVRFVMDSLHLNADRIIFIQEPPGIISSIDVNYNEGTIDFIFERTSIISDSLNNKEEYLNKVAEKVINEVQWKYSNGKKGTIKNVTFY